MSEKEQQRPINNMTSALSAVTRDEIIKHSISYFRKTGPDYGARLAQAVKALRLENRGDDITILVRDA